MKKWYDKSDWIETKDVHNNFLNSRETNYAKFDNTVIDKLSAIRDYERVIRIILTPKSYLKWKTTIDKQLKISSGKEPKMSIQVKQPISNKTMEAYIVGDEAKPHQLNLLDQIDFGAVYAIGMSVIIWGCFIFAFWSLI